MGVFVRIGEGVFLFKKAYFFRNHAFLVVFMPTIIFRSGCLQ